MIIIHSSNKTKYRLHKYLDYYYVNKSYIHYFIVYGEKVEPDPKYPYLHAKGCKDNTISLSGKNAYAYEYFLNNKNMGDFLYRAMDDTILNITNLEKLINVLRTIYNPNKHLIFRGYANKQSNNKVFLGGGSGWLMSRAMVKIHQIHDFSFPFNFHISYHHQDDTTETIILKRVGFRDAKVWDDPRWAESTMHQGEISNFLKGDFGRLKKCPQSIELISASEMIAMHGRDDIDREKWLYAAKYPNNVYLYRKKKCYKDSCSKLCIDNPGIVNNRTTMQYLMDNRQFITVDEIENRTSLPLNKDSNYIFLNETNIGYTDGSFL